MSLFIIANIARLTEPMMGSPRGTHPSPTFQTSKDATRSKDHTAIQASGQKKASRRPESELVSLVPARVAFK